MMFIMPDEALIRRGFIPTKLTFSICPFRALRVNLPSTSVITPRAVPSTITVAPGKLSPVTERTVPFISTATCAGQV